MINKIYQCKTRLDIAQLGSDNECSHEWHAQGPSEWTIVHAGLNIHFMAQAANLYSQRFKGTKQQKKLCFYKPNLTKPNS